MVLYLMLVESWSDTGNMMAALGAQTPELWCLALCLSQILLLPDSMMLFKKTLHLHSPFPPSPSYA